jgi:hypothetical protein
MADFILGATALACAAIALFFLRFWRQTGDRLFLAFALGFAVFAANRVVLGFLDERDEARTYVYLSRGLAFALLLYAIVDKNRGVRLPRRRLRRRERARV